MVIYLLSLMSSNELKPLARVVELVDSLASGASARKGVRVRLPPRAPKGKVKKDIEGKTSVFSSLPRLVDWKIYEPLFSDI